MGSESLTATAGASAAALAARAAAAQQAAAKPAGAKPLPDFASEADKRRHVTEFVKDNPAFVKFALLQNGRKVPALTGHPGASQKKSDPFDFTLAEAEKVNQTATPPLSLKTLQERADALSAHATAPLAGAIGDTAISALVSTGLMGATFTAVLFPLVENNFTGLTGLGVTLSTTLLHVLYGIFIPARLRRGVLIGALGTGATMASAATLAAHTSGFTAVALAWGAALLTGLTVSGALASGPQIVRNLSCRKAEKRALESLREDIAALATATEDAAVTRRFFQEHPEELKNFVTDYFARQIADEKGVIEAEIARLESEAEQLRRDQNDPALTAASEDVRAQILADNTRSLAEINSAQARLRAEALAPLERILGQIPALAAEIDAWMAERKNIDRLAQLATRARRGRDDAGRAEQLIEAMRGRLAVLVGSVVDAVGDAASANAAYVEVEKTVLKG